MWIGLGALALAGVGCDAASVGTVAARLGASGRASQAVKLRLQSRRPPLRTVEVTFVNGVARAAIPVRNSEYGVTLLDASGATLGPIRWAASRTGAKTTFFRAGRRWLGKSDDATGALELDLGTIDDDGGAEFGCSENPLQQVDSDGDNMSDFDDDDDDGDGTLDESDETPFGVDDPA